MDIYGHDTDHKVYETTRIIEPQPYTAPGKMLYGCAVLILAVVTFLLIVAIPFLVIVFLVKWCIKTIFNIGH